MPAPSILSPENQALLRDPVWRLSNIYSIRSKGGQCILFKPTAEQMEIIKAVYVKGWRFIIIPKARQRGISTLLSLICLDCILWGSGNQISIVDKTATDAEKKLDEKVKYAFAALDPAFQALFEVIKDNENEFRINWKGADKSKESFIFAGQQARGGTNQILWISEWGEVQMKEPIRSREILTGALPTAEHPGCFTIIETTWKGGKSGDMWPLVAKAMEVREDDKSPSDPRIIFVPWWSAPDYRDTGATSRITEKTHQYCNSIEQLEDTKIDDQQRLWYQNQADKYGMLVRSEYPSTLEECFDSPTQGAYFDAEGLKYQESQAVALSTRWRYGNIQLQAGRVPYFMASEPQQATVRILEMPQDGESYLIAADWCGLRMAVGAMAERDTNAFGVWRAGRLNRDTREYRPPQLVAAIMPDDRTGTTEAIRRIHGLYRLYGECMTVPETNNKDNVVEQMQNAGISNIWVQTQGAGGAKPGVGKMELVFGWYTNEGTRKQALENLREMVQQQTFIGSCSTLSHQLKMFIVPESGKPQAAPGQHDDWVLSTAIALFCIGSATPYREHRGEAMLNRQNANRVYDCPLHPMGI